MKTIKSALLLLGIVLLSPLTAISQGPVPNLEHQDAINGVFLPGEVHDVFQTEDGYLYFLSFDGLTRFDGSQYLVIQGDSVKDHQFIWAQQEETGEFLLRTWHHSLAIFKDGLLRPYPFNDSIPKNIKRSIISMFLDSAGQLHLGTVVDGHIVVSDSGTIYEDTTVSPEPTSFYIRQKWDNNLFIFRKGQGISNAIYLIDSLGVPQFVTKLYETPKVGRLRPFGLTLANGDMVFCNGTTLITIREGKELHRREMGSTVYNIFQDSEGGVWLSTYGDGAYYYPDWLQEKNQHILPGKYVGVMTEDSQNGLWLTVQGEGVCHMPDRWFQFYDKDNSILDHNVISGIEPGEDFVYVHTMQGGVFGVTKDSIWRLPLGDLKVQSIYFDQPNNTLWLGARGKMFTYQNGEIKRYELPLEMAKAIVSNFFPWPDGQSLGMIVGNSVVRWQDGAYVRRWSFGEHIYAVCPDFEGKLWVGAQSGLYVLTDGSWDHMNEQFLELDPQIRGLGVQGNRLWIGTNKNLFVLERDSLLKLNSKGDKALGMISDFEFLEDTALVYCSRGFYKLWLTPDADSSHGEEVLPSNSLLSKRKNLYTERLGEDLVFLTGSEGLGLVNLNRLRHFEPAVPVSTIQGVQINGEDVAVRSHYELEHDQQFIQLTYAGIGFRNNKRQEYHYRLSEVDEDWKRTTSKTIQYANLTPGDYTFEVKALARYASKFSQPAKLTFTIHPPYWETWWFQTLAVLFILVGISGGFFIRIRQLRNRNRLERALDQSKHQALAARMSPHFLFNALNSIQLFVVKNDEASSTRYVSKFSKLMRQILEHSGQLTVSLEEELAAIRNYLDLEQMRLKEKMTYAIEIDPELDVQRIFVPTMLIQPHVENAVWHGLSHRKDDQGKVIIRVAGEGDRLQIQVQDNGVGRQRSARMDYGKEHKSAGTTITENRMRLISSIFKVKLDVTIEDIEEGSTEGGTIVRVSLPKSFKQID